MAFLSSLSALILFTFCFFSPSTAQQPYVGLTTTDCPNQHNSSSGLGYFCNGRNRSCQTYLTFRSTPPYNTVSAISALFSVDPFEVSQFNNVSETSPFETDHLVFVPVNCSCSGQFYQANKPYTVKHGENYLIIANNTFQGLTTCQALLNQSVNPPAANISTNQIISVPLRCACPTKNQSDLGINYLVSYLVRQGDTFLIISQTFGVNADSVSEANDLPETLFPFTTLLIPLENPPSTRQTTEPPPPPPPPPTSPPTSSKSSKTWLYALLGALGGCAFLLVVGSIIYCRVIRKRKEKGDPILVSESFKAREKPEEKTMEESEDFLEHISDIAQSLKVYNFKELKLATDDFSASCWIKGSVYRGTINGDLAAIKKIDGDISKEINLLQKINHSNVIRLSGVSFNEGYWYLVYEYASNGPLSDWIFNNGKFLTWTQRIQIALDVATGLNYLHSFTNPSHVHKDIKSSSILLDSDFRAKIANFGLARSTQGESEGQFSLTKHIVGTIGYMAPEYMENGLVSPKLDVYAFGVLLLEMLTGKDVGVLYDENKHLSDAFSAVLKDEGQESLRDLMDPSMGENYPSEFVNFVVRIIESCLEKNPEARPHMDEIVQFLSRTLSNSLTWELSNNVSR
ncbi:hypothetical protein TIFTF001_002533 [Ficus carica]|uniref:Protein kinase domain-containing protein n=1 Tax=Ficus carica TaxID=3494 RepID=A0AA87Z6P6_FICCA|nr:hypothetical protein TIFTF001_002533 [Ficus carica]